MLIAIPVTAAIRDAKRNLNLMALDHKKRYFSALLFDMLN
jgi:hypothetical protein